VRITLSASGFAGTQEVLAKPLVIQTSDDGTWRTTLFSNGDITPANSNYAVTESGIDGAGGSLSYKILVPQTVGPFSAALITTP
jgi:hypothetical protein